MKAFRFDNGKVSGGSFRNKEAFMRLSINPVLLIGPGRWEEKGDTSSMEI